MRRLIEHDQINTLGVLALIAGGELRIKRSDVESLNLEDNYDVFRETDQATGDTIIRAVKREVADD